MHNKPKHKIAIVDYGMGNLFSVSRACEHAGLSAFITSNRAEIQASDGVILPGVGAFGDAMENLKRLDLTEVLRECAMAKEKPFLGICLGMQLLMSVSEEFGTHKGLDILEGTVVRLPSTGASGERIKVPKVGWNRIQRCGIPGKNSLLDGFENGEFMYFVHSFHVVPRKQDAVTAVTEYGGTSYCASLRHENIFACQFHPERSGRKGLMIYGNFARIVNDNKKRYL